MGTHGGIWETRDRGIKSRMNRKSVHQLTGSEIAALFFDTDLITQIPFAGNSNDVVGSHNGTDTGSPTYDADGGPDGEFITYNGSSQYTTLADEGSFDFERTDPFSVSFWIKYSTQSNKMIIGKATGIINTTGWQIWLQTGFLNVSLTNTDTTNQARVRTSDTNIDDNSWHLVTVTYDGSSTAAGIKIYFDGTAQSPSIVADTLSDTILNNTAVIIASLTGGSNHFAGSLDDLRIFSGELSADEVKQVMNDCRGGMTVTCTETGSGFTKDHVYQRNAENTSWDELAKTNAPSLTSPDIITDIELKAQAEARFADSDSTHYVGFKAPAAVSTNKIWTLPSADGSAKYVPATDGSGVLSFIPMSGTLLNGDDTQVSQSCSGSVVTAKTYTLPANSYTKIMVMVYGHWDNVHDAADDPAQFTVDVQVGGVSKKLITLNPPQFTGAQVADQNGDMWWSIMASFVQTTSADITIKGDHDGTDPKAFVVEGFYVFGMQ